MENVRCHTVTVNGVEMGFRLTSADAVKMESKTKKSLFELIQDSSITNICFMLRYLRKGADASCSNMSEDDSYKLFDKLADNGYAIETMLTEIILPALTVSGLLTKSDLDTVMGKLQTQKNQATQEA